MSEFSQAWVDACNARHSPKIKTPDTAYDGPESDIHEKIISYCRLRTWFVVHSRMDRKATTATGVPDFIIATRSGTLWIECKRKGSKPTPEQRDANYWLQSLGHAAHIVWSYEEFLAFAEKCG